MKKHVLYNTELKHFIQKQNTQILFHFLFKKQRCIVLTEIKTYSQEQSHPQD